MSSPRIDRWALALLVVGGISTGAVIATAFQGPVGQAKPLQLSITSAEEADGILKVALTNMGDKPVDGFVVSVYADGKIKSSTGEDLRRTDSPLRRGDSRTLMVPARGSTDLRVSAIYDDRTAVGDETAIADFFLQRAKLRDDLESWVSELKSLVDKRDVNLADTASRVQSLLDDNGVSGTVKGFADNVKGITSQSASSVDAKIQRLRSVLVDSEQELQKARVAATRQR